MVVVSQVLASLHHHEHLQDQALESAFEAALLLPLAEDFVLQ